MGSVWRALHVPTGVSVALKRVRTTRPSHAVALRSEVRAVARLIHPHIVVVHDHGVHDGEPWLTMELADGPLRRPTGGGDWPWTRGVLAQVLQGLAHAHARGLVHRDVKPANILQVGRGEGTRYLLADFGLARALSSPNAGRPAGTVPYMAPELFATGLPVAMHPAIDLYAVGALAWELLTGAPPFGAGSSRDVVLGHVAHPLPAFVPRVDVPTGLLDWLRCLLAKRPGDRFAFAADALWALDRLGAPTGAVHSPDPRAPALDETRTWDQATLDEASEVPAAAAGVPMGAPCGRVPLAETWAQPWLPAYRVRAGAGVGLLGLRVPPVRARRAERDALWAALQATREQGHPRAVWLHGPPGAGRSRLADWIGEKAHELGVAEVLRPRGTTIEAVVAAACGAEHLDADLTERWAERWSRDHGLTDPLDVAGLVALLRNDRSALSGQAEAWEVAARCLGGRCRAGALVVVLDEVDASSEIGRWVGWLQERRDPVLFVLVGRPPHEADAIVDVAPLDDREVAAVLDEGLSVEPALAWRIAELASGDLTLASALLTRWVATGEVVSDGDRLVPPPGVQPAVPEDEADATVASLHVAVPTASARHAVERAAIWEEPLSLARWAALCRADGLPAGADVVDALLDGGWASGYPGRWLLRPRVAASLRRLARIAGRARAHHAACAEEAVDPARRAVHLIEAGRALEAGDALWEAVDAWQHRQAYGRVVVLCGRYLEATRGAARSDRVWVMLFEGLALRRLGSPDAEDRIAAAVEVARGLADTDPLALVDGLRLLGERLSQVDLPGARDALTEALHLATTHALPTQAEHLTVQLADVRLRLGDTGGAHALITAMPRPASPAAVRAWLAQRGATFLAVGAGDEAAEAFEELLDVAPPSSPYARKARQGLAKLALARGQLEAARAHLTTMAADARDRRDLPALAVALNDLGALAWREDRPGEAERAISEAMALRQRTGQSTLVQHYNLGCLHLDRDARPEAVGLLEGAMEEPGSGRWRALLHAALARALADDRVALRHHLEQAAACLGPGAAHPAEGVRHAEAAAQTAHAAGDPEGADLARQLARAFASSR